MTSPRFRVVLDASYLDRLTLANGQFRYVVALLQGLQQLSVDTEFVVIGSKPQPAEEIAQVFRSPRWRYHRLHRWRFPGGAYLEHLRYAWLLVRERAQLFHALHSFVPVAAPCPVVATIFDLMFDRFPEYRAAARARPYRMYSWAVRHVVRRAICISESTARDVEQLWSVNRQRMVTVPLGTDVAAWARLARQPNERVDHLVAEGPVIVSPYNLEPRKNLASLLQAVAGLRPAFPALRLVLFGGGGATPEREALFRDTVRRLDLERSLELCGVLTDAELARLYARATIFVFPSLYEGFGLPLLEAMACGACVVARSASAMAEVVDGAGALGDVESPQVFAATLAALLRDPAEQARLRQAAPRRASSFTQTRMAEATYRVYQSLAGRAP